MIFPDTLMQYNFGVGPSSPILYVQRFGLLSISRERAKVHTADAFSALKFSFITCPHYQQNF
jgi:hypothetical protein